MILRDGTVIDHASCSYKYGRDPMAEYLHSVSMDMADDGSGGDVESPVGWFCQFGKRILRCDNYGNVWVDKHGSVDDALSAFDELEHEWIDWMNDVTCTECGTDFGSDEGSCWCCGARSYVERVR